jgi:hypothetical protein
MGREIQMRAKVNVADSLAAVSDYFSPKIVGYVNDLKIEVVKIRGDSSGTRILTRTISSSSSTVS